MLLLIETLAQGDAGVLDCADMVKSDQQLSTLTERVARLEERCKPLPGWLWGLLSILLAGLITYWGWLGSEVTSLNREMGSLGVKIDGLRKDVDRLLTPAIVRELALKPPTKENLSEIRRAIRRANEEKTTIELALLEKIGEKAAQASTQGGDTAPIAWDTFVDIVQYRTALNAWQAVGFVLGPIGKPGPQCIGLPENPTKLLQVLTDNVCDGRSQVLDGGDWRGGLFRNAVITYRGGPVRLTNVRFENCLFRFELTPRARELGMGIVAASPVTRDLSE